MLCTPRPRGRGEGSVFEAICFRSSLYLASTTLLFASSGYSADKAVLNKAPDKTRGSLTAVLECLSCCGHGTPGSWQDCFHTNSKVTEMDHKRFFVWVVRWPVRGQLCGYGRSCTAKPLAALGTALLAPT